MSEMLFTWLNQLELSRQVRDLGEDFDNGYLFAEIFYKYKMKHDFVKFVDDQTPEVKYENFLLLEPAFKSLGIKYNSYIVDRVMKGDRFIIATLLHKMKAVLDKSDTRLCKVLSLPILSKDSMMMTPSPFPEPSVFIKSSLFCRKATPKPFKVISPPKKIADMDKHLKKFYDFERDHEEKSLTKFIITNRQKEQDRKNKIFRLQIDNIHKSISKREDWYSQLKTWKEEDKSKRRENSQKERSKLENYVAKHTHFVRQSKDCDRHDVYGNIAVFEKKIGRISREAFYEMNKDTIKPYSPKFFTNEVNMPELVKKHKQKVLFSI